MAARDRYTIDITCPGCGNVGRVKVSEDDYPFMKKLHFEVDEVPDGFYLVRLGENASKTIFGCASCPGEIATKT